LLEETKATQMSDSRNLGGLIVLVVEDEFWIRSTMVAYLQELGCVVYEAETGETAVAFLDQGQPIDIVFTDIRLGGLLNGWDVAEAFRATRADFPIIYTSGYAIKPARPVSGSLYLRKPYQAAEVLNACVQLNPATRAH
jgi:CheY-like chemotaxis protein